MEDFPAGLVLLRSVFKLMPLSYKMEIINNLSDSHGRRLRGYMWFSYRLESQYATGQVLIMTFMALLVSSNNSSRGHVLVSTHTTATKVLVARANVKTRAGARSMIESYDDSRRNPPYIENKASALTLHNRPFSIYGF